MKRILRFHVIFVHNEEMHYQYLQVVRGQTRINNKVNICSNSVSSTFRLLNFMGTHLVLDIRGLLLSQVKTKLDTKFNIKAKH